MAFEIFSIVQFDPFFFLFLQMKNFLEQYSWYFFFLLYEFICECMYCMCIVYSVYSLRKKNEKSIVESQSSY